MRGIVHRKCEFFLLCEHEVYVSLHIDRRGAEEEVRKRHRDPWERKRHAEACEMPYKVREEARPICDGEKRRASEER